MNSLHPLCHHLGLGQPALLSGFLAGCIRYLYYILLVTLLGALEVRADQVGPALPSSVLIQYPMSKYKIFTFTYKAHIISPLADFTTVSLTEL